LQRYAFATALSIARKGRALIKINARAFNANKIFKTIKGSTCSGLLAAQRE
jgi:hypothetical protein